MQTICTENLYRVSDFPLIAAITVWLPIFAVDRTDPRRTYFLFERSNELDVIVANYNRRELRVEPQTYYHAIKNVKARLYEDS